MDGASTDEIDNIARRFVDDGKAPGLAYGIVYNGQVIHAGGFGVIGHGDEPPGVNSVFRIASMTKSFTAAAVLLLRDAGALNLDEPVATYVPAVADIPPVSADAPPLTLRMLLTMSSGFPSDDPWADRQESMSPAEFETLLRGGPRFIAVPGTEYHYSNLAYAIAGRAVSNICGQPYPRFVTDRFLRPLNMTATCFSSAEVPDEHLVTGYSRVVDDWRAEPFDQPGEFSAIGGLYSSVADLAIWVTGFVNATASPAVTDDHPLQPASRREMQQLHRLSDVATSAVGDLPHAVAKGYGMGLTLERHTHWGDVIGHSGGYPGFGSNMRWHPASGFGVIALANSRYAAPGAAAAAMLERLLSDGSPRHRPPTPWPELAPRRAAVERLLGVWDDALADEVFAMNMDLDQPRAERRQHVHALIDQLGKLDPNAPDDAECPSAADVDWTITGRLGQVRVEMGLSPEPSPKIQTLDLSRIEPAAPDSAPPATD